MLVTENCEQSGSLRTVSVTVIMLVSYRPPEMGVPPPGKAVLSMGGLSHSVIRVDTEEKLSVLTVQDVGQVMPGGTVHCTDNVLLMFMSKKSEIFVYTPKRKRMI